MSKRRSVARCAPVMSREVSARYPHDPPQQAAPGGSLLIWLSAVFSTDPELSCLHLIMTEMGSEDGLSNEACGRSFWVISGGHSGSYSGQFWSILVNSQENRY